MRSERPSLDFDRAPFLVLWELTRSCALACKHCRAKAIRQRNNNELALPECMDLLDRLGEFGKPLIVLTGGDPLERPDLFEIIEQAKMRGFTVAITPSATPNLNEDVVKRFADSGVDRVAISIDGPSEELHDGFRRVPGSFALSLDLVNWAQTAGLPLQINTTVWNGNLDRFEDMAALVINSHAVLWSLFFLVPTGRASNSMQITAQQCEQVMLEMAKFAAGKSVDVKATAGPHFRRVLLQYHQRSQLHDLSSSNRLGALRSYQSVNDGKGTVFISHTGDVYPSGFLPLPGGNVRSENIVDIYRKSDLFLQLRDPAMLKGKCGMCPFKTLCGGSRARAFAETGDWLAEDSLCTYQPGSGHLEVST